MSETASTRPRFDVFGTVDASWALIRRNRTAFRRFLSVYGVFGLIIFVLLCGAWYLHVADFETAGRYRVDWYGRLNHGFAFFILHGLLCWSAALAGLFHVFNHPGSEDHSFRKVLAVSVARAPIFGFVNLIFMAAFFLGLYLMVVPGLVILALFGAALPIMAAGRVPPWTAFARSVRLARPYWWPICGAHLVGAINFALLHSIWIAVPFLILWLQPALSDRSLILPLAFAWSLYTAFMLALWVACVFTAVFNRLEELKPGGTTP